MPKTLSYALRFRNDPKWKTENFHQANIFTKPPKKTKDEPDYVNRCFAKVQNIIDREFIKIVAERNQTPEVKIKVCI